MNKEYLEALNGLFDLIHCQDSFGKAQEYFDIIEEALNRLESIDNSEPSEALDCLERIGGAYLLWGHETASDGFKEEFNTIKQVLQKLDRYEQVLSNGRLTDRNYKNITLDLDSCKPYLKLGQLEDIYEEGK